MKAATFKFAHRYTKLLIVLIIFYGSKVIFVFVPERNDCKF